jgi:hypothetical protein
MCIAVSIFTVIPKAYGYLSGSKDFPALTICFINLFVLLSDAMALWIYLLNLNFLNTYLMSHLEEPSRGNKRALPVFLQNANSNVSILSLPRPAIPFFPR